MKNSKRGPKSKSEAVKFGSKPFSKTIVNNKRIKTSLVAKVAHNKKSVQSVRNDLFSYKELIDNVPIGLYKITPGAKGELLEINPAMLKIFEAETPEQILGKSISRSVYKDQAKRKLFSDELLKYKVLKDVVLELQTLKGNDIWCSVTAIAKHDVDGKTYFYGGVVDVTSRVKKEQAFLQAKLLIDSILETSPDGILVIGQNETIIYYNKVLVKMLNVPKKILDTKDNRLLIDHVTSLVKDQAVFSAHLKRLYKYPNKVFAEDIELKNGKIYERYSTVLMDHNGSYHGRVVFFRDITPRKKIENELMQSEEKLHAILDQTFQFIGLLKVDGTLIEANRSALNFSGIKESAVIGKPFWETPWWTHSRDEQNKLREAIKKAAEGEFIRFETTHLSSSGSMEYIDFSLKPVFDESGRVSLIIPEGRPITDLKKAEANYRNIFENVPDAICEVDFSEQKKYLDGLTASGIVDLEVFFKTNPKELMDAFKKIRILNLNKSFLNLLEAKDIGEFIAYSKDFFGINDFDVIKDIMMAIVQNRSYFRIELEGMTIKKNKKEVIFQYSVSPFYEDFSKTLVTLTDITKQKQIEKQLAYSSVHDPLTGLPNRNLFDESLIASIARAKRVKTKMALLYVDIDYFKNINDVFGHDVGDLLLVKLGSNLQLAIREDDFVARIGGDEFVVILNNLNEIIDAGQIAKKMLKKVSGNYKIESQTVDVTISIGIAIYPDASDDANLLKKYADVALYSVKNNGRNNYKYYISSKDYISKDNLEKEFLFALKSKQLYLMYQPKYNVKNNTIFGIEVLIRWQHDYYGLIFPENFIPCAEKSGMMLEIGAWIIEKASEDYVKWFKNFDKKEKPRLEINLSYQQLQQKDFLSSLNVIFKKTGMSPHDLSFEITEQALELASNSQEVTHSLFAEGIRISIDDVGYNMSFLQKIKDYSVSTVKINQNIIAEVLSDIRNAEIVGNIITFGNDFNINVVAEGVENKAQVNYLNDVGCFIMQGYDLCKPEKDESIRRIIKDGLRML